jgi:hypothetical protein
MLSSEHKELEESTLASASEHPSEEKAATYW